MDFTGASDIKVMKDGVTLEAGDFPFKPFSYGPRDCPGQRLALLEVRHVLPFSIPAPVSACLPPCLPPSFPSQFVFIAADYQAAL